jgi:hypothetical protein
MRISIRKKKTMKLSKLGPNTTELDLANGTTVLFSYKTPVAAYVVGRGLIKTEKKYSVTTSKHINQWLEGREHETVDQLELDRLTGAL